ncbi:MAG TPA: glycosyltransferase family 4 protein [Planctomycetota bacterium]|nr:glycosyltransferase family 4 protein [Planctomycetota bacterium]
MTQPRLIYALFSGNLYGTERMAIETLLGLANTYDGTLMGPDGIALEEARRRGLNTVAIRNMRMFRRALASALDTPGDVVVITTSVRQALSMEWMQRRFGARLRHVHAVHGGCDERKSFGRKWVLNFLSAPVLAVSEFVAQRLRSHGVREERILVVENFLSSQRFAKSPREEPAMTEKSVVVVSRLDPIKRVDLLLRAIDGNPALRQIPFKILGQGSDFDNLRSRASKRYPNVTFRGFVREVEREVSTASLFLHLCPEEPFGLAILEAMALGVPVLVPDRGGAAAIVEDGRNGFLFKSDNAADLATRLQQLMRLQPEDRKLVVDEGLADLSGRFSEGRGLSQYRRLLETLR